MDDLRLNALWGPRHESIDVAADRVTSFMTFLRVERPDLGEWFEKAETKQAALKHPVPASAESIAALLARHRHIDSAGHPNSELGYHFGLWNGQSPAATIGVTISSSVANLSNSLALVLPNGFATATASPDKLTALLDAAIGSFEPDWATISSRRIRDMQSFESGRRPAGLMTYVNSKVDSSHAGGTRSVGAGTVFTLPTDMSWSLDDLLTIQDMINR